MTRRAPVRETLPILRTSPTLAPSTTLPASTTPAADERLHAHAAPAERYVPAEDLWVITAHFNPSGYRSRHANLDRFVESLRRSGQPLRLVECAFGDAPWTLDGPEVVRVRARDVLWQKERLLNVALRTLPPTCTKVAWIDGDVLFSDPAWALRTSALLDEAPVVQCFSRAIRLPRDRTDYRGEGAVYEGFAAVQARAPRAHAQGRYDAHGHTGFAWAARRELLERHGLYDAHMASNNDHLMAHALCGDTQSACVTRMLGSNARARSHFARWATRIYREVRGRIGVVDATALHLWHGDPEHRRHAQRARELAECGVDPATDLRINEEGCWEWATERPELRQWAVDFFRHRFEDGLHEQGGRRDDQP